MRKNTFLIACAVIALAACSDSIVPIALSGDTLPTPDGLAVLEGAQLAADQGFAYHVLYDY